MLLLLTLRQMRVQQRAKVNAEVELPPAKDYIERADAALRLNFSSSRHTCGPFRLQEEETCFAAPAGSSAKHHSPATRAASAGDRA